MGRYPRHRENGKNNPCQGKHREFGNFVKTQGKHTEFCLNTRKRQEILLAQFVNVLILKVKGIAIVAGKKIIFFPRSWIGLPSQFCVCNTHKLCKLARKIYDRTGKTQGIRKYVLSGYPAWGHPEIKKLFPVDSLSGSKRPPEIK